MQLNIIGKTIKPLTIAAGLTVTNPVMYTDLDQYSAITSIITSHQTDKYIKIADSQEDQFQKIEHRFRILYQSWKQKTMFLSSAKAIVDNEEFKGIVAMGRVVTPLIIDAIDREPSQLVWALNYIYGAKISNNPNTTIKEACKLWVKRFRS